MKTFEELGRLTPEQEKAPYAHFYCRPAPVIQPECMRIIENGSDMCPDDAITDVNISQILYPDKINIENGYCVLPDGTGYVAACHHMPQVTYDMYRFWLGWWTAEDSGTRYKVWCPGKHFAAFHTYTAEDIGGDYLELYFGSSIRPDPSLISIDTAEMAKSTCVMADGGNFLAKVYGAKRELMPTACLVCHFIYLDDANEGITMRSRFWFGCQALDGHITRVLEPGRRITMNYLSAFYEHNCLEMSYLRDLLPPLYEQEVLDKVKGS